MRTREDSVARVLVRKVGNGGGKREPDTLVVEEPMEIRLGYGPAEDRRALSLSITMRTPGDDFELAAGFLLTEGIVTGKGQITAVERCGPAAPGRETGNIVRVEVTPDVPVDPARLQRNFYATSSCGICGKASLDAVEIRGLREMDRSAPVVRKEMIHDLPSRMREGQMLFHQTGGIHGAGLFQADGTLLEVREDVGRHNAVDKLVGGRLLAGSFPLHDTIMTVSGRAGFEIVQKAVAAEIPVVVSVGAPSTLSVSLAERFGMTLIGFVRDNRYNIYTCEERIHG
ncbi:MAG: formate dehydrogenase accessory sulfurtransferase FdhD [Acidobacteria bacterium]|uniref:Sulfur carrier protein FdhD n=1 Tax=Candidatus Polarisedimenticola svalbardensis TaxID=2886004 RepID=A0A8J7CKM8_9BACT|nr:formate dehydrogenase accessory sulfurtransferase FdhD [Candidatus Polarisedimenticola svalbardensis]